MFDVESPMRFESALSVPKIVKFLHVVTSLLIGAHLRRLDYLNINDCVSCTKSFFAGGIQTKNHTSNVVEV